MPRIYWDGSLETGDDIVDNQHRTMIEMFNGLLDADARADADQYLPTALEALSEYVSTHFSAEEKLMRQHSYPDAASAKHIEQHRELSRRTRAMIVDYSAGRMESISPVVDLLCDWLADHISTCDRALIDHVQAEKLAG